MAHSPERYHGSDLEVLNPDLHGQTQSQQLGKPMYQLEQTDQTYPPYYGQDKPTPKERTIFGVRTTAILWFVGLLLVAVAAGIGGGVGGSIAVKSVKDVCEATKQAVTNPSDGSETSTAPFSITTTPALLLLDCPRVDKTTVRITLDDTSNFLVTCGQEIGKPDILAIVSYSKEDCAKACASYNRNLGKIGCKGVVFDSQFANTVKRNFGTCFLKSNTSVLTPSTNSKMAGMVLQ